MHYDGEQQMTIEPTAPTGLEILQLARDGVLAPPGIAVLFEMRMDVLEFGHVAFSFEADERVHNPMGTVHGGAIASLADSALACAVHSTLGAGVGYTSLDLNLHFVKSVPRGRIVADGRVLHSGGRIATAECKVTTAEGTLLAHGSSTCIILRPGR